MNDKTKEFFYFPLKGWKLYLSHKKLIDKIGISLLMGIAMTFTVALFISLMPVTEKIQLESNKLYNSKTSYIFKSLWTEFSYSLLVVFSLLSYVLLSSRTIKDYFPFSEQLKESGIHAKLNYQIIADRMSRKLTVLLSFIIIFSLVILFTIFKFSSELDLIIHQEDIDAYEVWISSIEKHVGKTDEGIGSNSEKLYEFVETNTKMLWMVYFARYITVRLFIAFLVATLITFLIRLYLRTKTDRSLIIQKEETLSAIHYLARGEWRYQYDLDGNLLFIHRENKTIITEKKYSELLTDKEKYIPLTLDILKNEEDMAAHIKTTQLLDVIPIRELFTATEYIKTKKGSNINVSDYANSLESIKKQLSDITNELKNIVIIQNRTGDANFGG